MLVISRKVSESIMIGNDIEIVVTEIGSERVKIGINAPKGVPILRRELLETREMNREAAAQCLRGQAAPLSEAKILGRGWRESPGKLPAAGGSLPHVPPGDLVGGAGTAGSAPPKGPGKK